MDKMHLILLLLVTVTFSQKQMTIYKNDGSTIIASIASIDSIKFDPGSMAEYLFTGNANNLTCNNYHGIVSNALLTSDRFGASDRAYYFNGQNAYISLGDTADFSIFNSQEESTISLWIKFNSLDKVQSIISAGLHNNNVILPGGNKYLSMEYHPSGIGANDAITFFLYDSMIKHQVISSKESIKVDQWHHIVIVRNNDIRIYIDNINKSASKDNPGWTTNYNPSISTTSLMIGARQYSDNTLNDFLSGSVDDIRIYKRALLEREITNLYKEGN